MSEFRIERDSMGEYASSPGLLQCPNATGRREFSRLGLAVAAAVDSRPRAGEVGRGDGPTTTWAS